MAVQSIAGTFGFNQIRVFRVNIIGKNLTLAKPEIKAFNINQTYTPFTIIVPLVNTHINNEGE